MPEHPFTEHLPYLRHFLAAKFGRLSDADREDIVQEVCMAVWKLPPDFVPDSPWTTYLTRAAINAAIGHLKRAERGWFQSLADESAGPAISSAIPSPPAIADESDRRVRQTLLLSDILREYVARCEHQAMQTQKEIYERRVRGQEPVQIAEQMGLSENNVYKAVQRARDWVRDRMQQADVARSVFQTFLRPRRETPVTSGLPDHVPHNFSDVLHRVVHEAGALCPSDARLALYLASPNEAELRDVRYHVEEAGGEGAWIGSQTSLAGCPPPAISELTSDEGQPTSLPVSDQHPPPWLIAVSSRDAASNVNLSASVGSPPAARYSRRVRRPAKS